MLAVRGPTTLVDASGTVLTLLAALVVAVPRARG